MEDLTAAEKQLIEDIASTPLHEETLNCIDVAHQRLNLSARVGCVILWNKIVRSASQHGIAIERMTICRDGSMVVENTGERKAPKLMTLFEDVVAFCYKWMIDKHYPAVVLIGNPRVHQEVFEEDGTKRFMYAFRIELPKTINAADLFGDDERYTELSRPIYITTAKTVNGSDGGLVSTITKPREDPLTKEQMDIITYGLKLLNPKDLKRVKITYEDSMLRLTDLSEDMISEISLKDAPAEVGHILLRLVTAIVLYRQVRMAHQTYQILFESHRSFLAPTAHQLQLHRLTSPQYPQAILKRMLQYHLQETDPQISTESVQSMDEISSLKVEQSSQEGTPEDTSEEDEDLPEQSEKMSTDKGKQSKKEKKPKKKNKARKN